VASRTFAVKYLRIVARDAVLTHWPHIEAVGQQLLARKTLTRDEIAEIVWAMVQAETEKRQAASAAAEPPDRLQECRKL
jgi:hypothetical protein